MNEKLKTKIHDTIVSDIRSGTIEDEHSVSLLLQTLFGKVSSQTALCKTL